jgi:hypothetical protein
MNLDESSNGISSEDSNTSDRRLATDIFFSFPLKLFSPYKMGLTKKSIIGKTYSSENLP